MMMSIPSSLSKSSFSVRFGAQLNIKCADNPSESQLETVKALMDCKKDLFSRVQGIHDEKDPLEMTVIVSSEGVYGDYTTKHNGRKSFQHEDNQTLCGFLNSMVSAAENKAPKLLSERELELNDIQHTEAMVDMALNAVTNKTSQNFLTLNSSNFQYVFIKTPERLFKLTTSGPTLSSEFQTFQLVQYGTPEEYQEYSGDHRSVFGFHWDLMKGGVKNMELWYPFWKSESYSRNIDRGLTWRNLQHRFEQHPEDQQAFLRIAGKLENLNTLLKQTGIYNQPVDPRIAEIENSLSVDASVFDLMKAIQESGIPASS
jgi:hypothetical protein